MPGSTSCHRRLSRSLSRTLLLACWWLAWRPSLVLTSCWRYALVLTTKTLAILFPHRGRAAPSQLTPLQAALTNSLSVLTALSVIQASGLTQYLPLLTSGVSMMSDKDIRDVREMMRTTVEALYAADDVRSPSSEARPTNDPGRGHRDRED